MTPKNSKIAILIIDKVDFKPKLVRRDKKGHFILIKGSIYQEEITVDLYLPNVSVPNFIKHTLLDLKTQIRPQHSDMEDCNTLLLSVDR
jgi:hypothetical protein